MRFDFQDEATAPAAGQSLPIPKEQAPNSGLRLEFLMVLAAVVMICSAYLLVTNNRLATSEAAREYTVVAGDTLTKLAERFYGSNTEWGRIYNANRKTLKHPDRVDVGVKLTIPSGERTDESPAAGSGQSQ